MIRDLQVQLAEAVTWYATTLGVSTSASAAQDALQAATRGKIEEFAAAYVAANTAADSTGSSPR
jgi:predicted Zn-dependent peptidase